MSYINHGRTYYCYALHIKPQDLTKRLQLLIMQVGDGSQPLQTCTASTVVLNIKNIYNLNKHLLHYQHRLSVFPSPLKCSVVSILEYNEVSFTTYLFDVLAPTCMPSQFIWLSSVIAIGYPRPSLGLPLSSYLPIIQIYLLSINNSISWISALLGELIMLLSRTWSYRWSLLT